MPDKYPNLFKSHYPPCVWRATIAVFGKLWLRALPPEDRAAFVSIGLQAAHHGKLGGTARARTSQRDARGRFISTEDNYYDQLAERYGY